MRNIVKYNLFFLALILGSSSVFAGKSILYLGSLFPEATQIYYQNLQKQLMEKGIATMQNTLPNKMHVTLKFAGMHEDSDKAQFAAKVKQALSEMKMPSIKVKPKGFKVLSNRGKATMILALVESPELQKLFNAVDDKLAVDNIAKKDARAFLAHMTIGTFKPGPEAPDAKNIEEILGTIEPDNTELAIDELQLMALPSTNASEQYQDPNNYEVLASFPSQPSVTPAAAPAMTTEAPETMVDAPKSSEVSTSENGALGKNSDPECKDEIFLPANVFKYPGRDARRVWLGVTNIPQNLQEYAKDLGQKLSTLAKAAGIARGRIEAHPHVTLKFLGGISPDSCADKVIIRALKNVLVFPMKLMPAHLKILKNPNGTPRLIALSFESPNLKLFKLSVENALDGFANRDRRDYWVHMTLFHFPANTPVLSPEMEETINNMDVAGGPFKVNGFELVQSGAVLKVLHAFGEKGLNSQRGQEVLAAMTEKIAEDKPKETEAMPESSSMAPQCETLFKYWADNKDIYYAATNLKCKQNPETSEKVVGFMKEIIATAEKIMLYKGSQEGDEAGQRCELVYNSLRRSLATFLKLI